MSFFGENPYPNYTSQSISVGEFCRKMKKDDAGIRIPDYQREFVWTTVIKQGYLQTLSQRGPIFGFVMNYNSDDGTYEVIDGQNRGKTIFEFMNDKLSFNRGPEEGGALKYSEMENSEKRKFDHMEIHYIKTFDWSDDECQEYFRSIQEGMKLTKGEEIHSAQNNIFQNKIVYLVNLYKDILTKKRKEGGFNYTGKRYIEYEVFGCLLKCFMNNRYYDRPGQIAMKELKHWDNFPTENLSAEDTERLDKLNDAVTMFEKVMDYMCVMRDNCEHLTTKQYSRDAIFIRNTHFIFLNKLYEHSPTDETIQKFSEMMNIILTKNTPRHDQITLWSTKGGMENIMIEYARVYDDPTVEFEIPAVISQ